MLTIDFKTIRDNVTYYDQLLLMESFMIMTSECCPLLNEAGLSFACSNKRNRLAFAIAKVFPAFAGHLDDIAGVFYDDQLFQFASEVRRIHASSSDPILKAALSHRDLHRLQIYLRLYNVIPPCQSQN